MSQLFAWVAGLKQEEDQVELLRRNWHPSVAVLLRSILDPKVTWLVSEPFDYEPCTWKESESNAYFEFRRLYLFQDGGERPNPIALQPFKMRKLFGDLLSSLPQDDCHLLIDATRKELPLGISAELIVKAYPELLVTDQREEVRRNLRKLTETAQAMKSVESSQTFRKARMEAEAVLAQLERIGR
jgi:hypothetical protein